MTSSVPRRLSPRLYQVYQACNAAGLFDHEWGGAYHDPYEWFDCVQHHLLDVTMAEVELVLAWNRDNTRREIVELRRRARGPRR